MDLLTVFGLFAVTAMLVTYALEDRSPWFILAFAFACLLGSAYGSCREPGLLVFWRQFGPVSQAIGGVSALIGNRYIAVRWT